MSIRPKRSLNNKTAGFSEAPRAGSLTLETGTALLRSRFKEWPDSFRETWEKRGRQVSVSGHAL